MSNKRLRWFLLAATLVMVGVVMAPHISSGQDATAAVESGSAMPAQQNQSMLGWMIRASGLIGLVILGMSFYLVAVVAWMFVHFKPSQAVPPRLVEELEGLLSQRQYDRAYAKLVADGSFLARTLVSGVRKLSSGLATAQRAMELANEDLTMAMEHRTTYLATIGTLGPMVGLVGTVYGMIKSFQAIATMGASPQASHLAAGISTSLFATLEGIIVSVPAIAFYAYFRNRIARISIEAQLTAESLLEQFSSGARTTHPLATTTTAPPPPQRPSLPPQSS